MIPLCLLVSYISGMQSETSDYRVLRSNITVAYYYAYWPLRLLEP